MCKNGHIQGGAGSFLQEVHNSFIFFFIKIAGRFGWVVVVFYQYRRVCESHTIHGTGMFPYMKTIKIKQM